MLMSFQDHEKYFDKVDAFYNSFAHSKLKTLGYLSFKNVKGLYFSLSMSMQEKYSTRNSRAFLSKKIGMI